MEITGAGAVVSGGASGLGEAVVRLLARRGAVVTILDRDAERGAALVDELGDAVTFVAADVTDDDEVGHAIAIASEQAPLRIAVNCAGIGGGVRSVDRTGKPHSRNVWHRIVDVNLWGTFLVLTHAASRIARTDPNDSGQRGVIINTASIAAFDGQIGQLAYAASKAAVVGMTLPAARDLAAAGIRVCTIAPGLMDTPLLARLDDAARDALVRDIVHPHRLGVPEEFAHLGVAIIENDYLNGETIRLDAALRMAPR